MRKKFCLAIVVISALCACLCAFTGCFKSVNYLDYVSEKRSEIYLYQDDDTSIKIFCSQKEQPYRADGIKGEMCDIVEFFVFLPKTYDEVWVKAESFEGEMNYRSVERGYYLSFTAKAFEKDAVDVTLRYGEETKTYSALSVKTAGIMSCENAVKCVIEHDKALFDSLTQNRIFNAEIYVRLLHDDGCFYYVGICDRNKKITAFLIDGEKGKIIATKEIQG